METTEDLNNARKKLESALGEKMKQYFKLMKLWFQLKTTKEEFDAESRKLMSPEQIHLHNEFLLCLFSKCGSLATISPPVKTSHLGPVKDNKLNRRTKVKRRNRSDKGNFEHAEITDFIAPVNAPPSHAQDEPLRYCAQELFLPDMSLILGRLMLCAWEQGLEGAEENAAELILVAVQQFLKNILMSIFSRRKGYKLRENCFMYSLGAAVPNPWLRNTVNLSGDFSSRDSDEMSNEDSKSEPPPATKLSLDEIEQKTAYEIACSSNVDNTQYPVNSYQVLETLQVNRNLVSSHTIYAVNIERIISALKHPTTEEMEAAT